MISQNTIQKIFELDIVDVFKCENIALKKSGANYVTNCIFHNENSSSLTISPAKGIYKCFGCGKGGNNGINLVQELHKLNYPQAIEHLAKLHNITVEYEVSDYTEAQKAEFKALRDSKESLFAVLNKANEYYQKELLANPEALAYLRSRHISDEIIALFGLGYKPYNFYFSTNSTFNQEYLLNADITGKTSEGKTYDKFSQRITIPLENSQKRVIGFAGRILPAHEINSKTNEKKAKYLNTSETKLYNKSDFLYGLSQAAKEIQKQNLVFLVEGYPNVWRMSEIGFANTVAIGGTSFTDAQAKQLKKLCSNIVIAFDPDKIKGEYHYEENGEQKKRVEEGTAINNAIEIALENGFDVKVLALSTQIPQGKKHPHDIDELVVKLLEKDSKNYQRNATKVINEAIKNWLYYAYTYTYSENTQAEFIDTVCKRIASIENDVIRGSYETFMFGRFKNIRKVISKKIKEYSKDANETPEPNEATGNNRVDYKADGTIWVFTKKNWTQIFDHHIAIKYFAEDEFGNVSWILSIKQPQGEEETLEISNDDFCSANKLKNVFMTKLANFKGSSDDLNELHQYLLSKHFEKATKVVRYGYEENSGLFFFANKAVDTQEYAPNELGVVKNDKGFFVMPETNPKVIKGHRFTLEKKHISFNEWFEMYSTAHKHENAFIPACFYIMSLFRDIVVSNTKASPILYLKGGAGTGKSSIVRNLTALFGKEQKGINLKTSNTEKSLIRMMGQSSNTVIWFDEFYNGFQFEGLLQAAYDNDGYNIADAKDTTKTHSIDIFSALALTSNYTPENNIFFSRCVFMPINDSGKTAEQKVSFDNLTDLEKTKGLGCVSAELLAYREHILKSFSEDYDKIYKCLKKHSELVGVMERAISNLARLLTPAYILQSCGFVQLTESSDKEDVFNEFIEFGKNTILRQHNIQNEKTEASIFFEIVQQLYDNFQLHEKIDFQFVDGKGGMQIALNFPKLYNAYCIKYKQIKWTNAPERSVLQSELAIIENQEWGQMEKAKRFTNEEGVSMPVKCSCFMTYKTLQDKFGLMLQGRIMPDKMN